MVSIPSTRLRNFIHHDINKNQKLKIHKSQYNTKLLIKEAENEGYFTDLSVRFLNEKFTNQDTESDENMDRDRLQLVCAINLDHHNIQKVGSLGFCINLVYLNLSKNFLSSFTELERCDKLIYLDLSSNLIEVLPDFQFWNRLSLLRFLHLHDNPLANADAVLGLCHSSKLAVLSLWDTPLALRRQYRHFVVNSIWSLQLLDWHLVSDEEIIEDACFGRSRFRALSDALRANGTIRVGEEHGGSFDGIELDLRDALVQLNRRLAHWSPVLIIQRWIRGFLVRRRLMKARGTTFDRDKRHQNQVDIRLPEAPESPFPVKSADNESKDKVTYLKIDLVHLHQVSTLQNLEKEAIERSIVSSGKHLVGQRSVTKRPEKENHSPEHISGSLNTVRRQISELQSYPLNVDFEDEENFFFRFRGSKPPTAMKNMSGELQLEKSRCHHFMKEAHRVYHEKLSNQFPEIKSRPVRKTNSEELFRKTQGCMGLFLLNKYDRAERDIRKLEQLQEKMNDVQVLRNDREFGNFRFEEAKLRKIANVKAQHCDHVDMVERSFEMAKENLRKNTEEVRQKKIIAVYKKSKIMNEVGFSLDFRSKQGAACNAMDKFDQMAQHHEKLELNRKAVDESKMKSKLEMETVKNYLENQSLAKRAERNIENALLDLQVLQQTNNRMNDSKMRVERLKSIRRLVSCPHLPVIQLNMKSFATQY